MHTPLEVSKDGALKEKWWKVGFLVGEIAKRVLQTLLSQVHCVIMYEVATYLMASLWISWASWAAEEVCLRETGGPVWVGLKVSLCVLASLRLCPESKCLLAAPRLNRKLIWGIEGGVDWISKGLLLRWGSFENCTLFWDLEVKCSYFSVKGAREIKV